MALVLTDFFDNDTVRGLLGVAETEIPDDIFTSLAPIHLHQVVFSLEELNDTIPTLFETIRDIAVGTRTALQARFHGLVQLYAAYAVALDIANGSVEMFAPKTITDGKATTDRADPYAPLRQALKASLGLWATRLGRVLTQLDATQEVTAITRTLASTSGLALDPVTGV